MFAAAAAARQLLDVPVWSVAPFVGLLLTIAILPLFAEHFWHSNFKKLLVSLGFAVPVVGYLLYLELIEQQEGLEALYHGLLEYADFIVLLGSLYVVAGGILIQGDVEATPFVNAAFLAGGAVLANFIGTTGASMVLIRPVLRINRQRQHTSHLPIFFIFVVSNVGGLLTPLGDPPLFLGFLRGVEFFWTMQLWPQWLLVNAIVLLIFIIWDSYARSRETAIAVMRDVQQVHAFRVHGLVNIVLLAAIIATVLFQSPRVAEDVRVWLNHWFVCPDLHLVRPWPALVMILMAALSLLLTPRHVRSTNGFNWHAITEVAVLFFGIFVTMIPALDLLARHGRDLGLTQPSEYFWWTGILSAFLDNAPTYLTFATIAAEGQPIANLANHPADLLQAISCGAVFLGAMTYIGNGPNFMVKSIAEGQGFKLPSFFGYMMYSCAILLPTFFLVQWLFFG